MTGPLEIAREALKTIADGECGESVSTFAHAAFMASAPTPPADDVREALAEILKEVLPRGWVYTTTEAVLAACEVRLRGTGTAIERRKFPKAARGDGPCMDCGTLDTPVWFTDNVTWNTVVGGERATEDPGGFLCPVCFIARAHEGGLRPVSWRIYPEFPRRYAAKAREVSL